MKEAFFANSRMNGFFALSCVKMQFTSCGNRFHFNSGSVHQAKGQFVSVNLQFHRIAHRGEFGDGNFGTGKNAHIQKMLTQNAFPSDGANDGTLTDFEFAKRCHQAASKKMKLI